MFVSSVGMSSGIDGKNATSLAIKIAKSQLQAESPNAAIVFASSEFNQQEVVDTAMSLLPEGISLIGTSTAGEISQNGPSGSPSVLIMLLASDTVGFVAASVKNAAGNEEAAGAELAEKLKTQTEEEIKFITLHSDGLTVNPSAILRSLDVSFPELPITGGSSGDDGNFKQTYQYHNGTVMSSGLTALAFTGNLNLAISVRHGWSPISAFRTITKTEGNVVYEIDDKPAIELYEEYIGKEEAANLKNVTLGEVALSYPLGVKDTESGVMLLRAPITVDNNGYITFGGEMSEGDQVQLMIGSKEQAVEAARDTAEYALKEFGEKPGAALIFTCHVRNTLFKSRDESKLEIQAIQNIIGKDVPLAGFYTYAEQAPVDDTNLDIKTCNSKSHNETIVTVLLGETK
ncbi:MAG: FIST C-terminal domain-containing protein [Candidatus Pacebacteria bacterium]|nr:FIST C-terminal domain-containing protein [Candidatus Paceibacterota bacterium]